MKIATTTGDYQAYGFTQEESVRRIHQAGFRYIDYSFGRRWPDNVFSDDWRANIQNLLRVVDALGVRFVQGHAPMGRKTSDPIAPDNTAFIEENIRCLECCALLGIPNLVVHCGFGDGILKEENFRRNKAFYEKLLPTAEKYGIHILIENLCKMNRGPDVYWTDNSRDLLELIEYVDHPLIQACWDIGHANTQSEPSEVSLRRLGSHLKALHVQDNLGVPDFCCDAYPDPHLPPLFGSVSFDGIMQGLLEIGYDGYFTLETGIIFSPFSEKRPCAGESRLLKPLPLEIKDHGERLLYLLCRYILQTYDCFEE